MQKTLQNNPAIQQAKIELEKAAGQRLVLRSIFYPEANLKVIAGVAGGHRIELSDESKAFGFPQANFAQALFNAAIPASRRRGDIELLLAQQRLNIAIVEQLHKTRVAFYTALYNRSLETLRDSQKQQLEADIEAQQARYEAGTTERNALTAVRLHAHELGPKIETARQAGNVALLDLAEAMGIDLGPDAPLPTPEGELRFVATHENAKNAVPAALERRVDIKLARLLVRAADEETRVVQADFYPAVRMIAAGDYIPVSGFDARGAVRRVARMISFPRKFASAQPTIGASSTTEKLAAQCCANAKRAKSIACCWQNWRRTFRANWLASKTICARLMRNTIR